MHYVLDYDEEERLELDKLLLVLLQVSSENVIDDF